jgi:hypothetical protein
LVRRSQFVFLVLLVGMLASAAAQTIPSSPAKAQTTLTPAPTALLRGVTVVRDKHGPAIEIISSRPVVPSVKKLDSPTRLVIDLPNTRMTLGRKWIGFHSEQVSGVRIDQYQQAPPMARVVVDLLRPVDYTWDAAGNRLMVRLKPTAEPMAASAPPLTVPAFTTGVSPAAIPVSSGASGAVVLAGSRVAAGSAVTAGSDTAILHLPRGGEVRVCPGTTVSVTPSQTGRELMLGMSTGAMETHYRLDASADTILTPDFRILLAGPGEFDYAISVDRRGNTCVRTLSGNTASAIISELMGEGTYQVKPAEQIVFHSGRLRAVDSNVPADCGCPQPATPVLRTSAPPEPVLTDANLPATLHLAQPKEEIKPVPPPVAYSELKPTTAPSAGLPVGPETAPLPPSNPAEIHVKVDAPFVFRASKPQPAPIPEAAQLPLTASARPEPFPLAPLPPPPSVPKGKPKSEHHGFFRKLGGVFAAIFR